MCHSLLLHDPNCLFLKTIKVISSPELSSRRHNTASRLSVPLQALDDVLKELHGRHYIFILFRIGEQMKETCIISSLLHVKSVSYWFYLLAGFYEFINCHHSISVPIHFLKKVKKMLKHTKNSGGRLLDAVDTWKNFSTCSKGDSSRTAGEVYLPIKS